MNAPGILRGEKEAASEASTGTMQQNLQVEHAEGSRCICYTCTEIDKLFKSALLVKTS